MKHKTFFKHYTIMSKGFEHFEKLFIKMVSNKIVPSKLQQTSGNLYPCYIPTYPDLSWDILGYPDVWVIPF